MTKAEFEARKRWDTSIMTEEEKEARVQRILSHCGKIDDETFVPPHDAFPTIPDDVYDEEDFVKTINELCGSISDEAFRLYPEEAV